MDNFNDRYKKKNPFSVPDDYFEGLTEHIIEQTKPEKTVKKLHLVTVLRPYMKIAGVLMVAFLMTQIVWSFMTDSGQGLKKNSTDIVSQIEEVVDEFIFDSQFNPTSEEIIEYLAIEVDNYELMFASN